MTSFLLQLGLKSRWQFTTLRGNVCLQWPRRTSLIFSYRLCKLCARLVSLFGVSPGFLPSHHLHFRLNSRDYIRDRASPDNSFALSSIRVAPPGEAFGSQSKQTGVSVVFRRSTPSAHTQNTFDPNVGHAFEGPKLVRSLRFAFLATRSILTLAG